MAERSYIAIDLKSFYASVECIERGLDPLTANLVVADTERTEKTICLAVSPALKSCGIPGRARLFEVVQKVRAVNRARLTQAPEHTFYGSSFLSYELAADPSLELDYIAAKPRMSLYMEYSTRIYNIYTRYISPEDIHVYSVDEVFMDVTGYLKTYDLTPRELAMKLILEVLKETGITATAGIGPNLYLCKIAMDIEAKHIPADKNGVRIAELDEISYRKKLWQHRPLTDFWRVGPGYRKKLEKNGLFTMGDIARCSLGAPTDFHNEELLYSLFGVNAELLIDHAWGWEPCTIADIRAYRPGENSISSGQVLPVPYDHVHARLVVHEMTDLLVMDLLEKHLVTDRVSLTVCYDTENLTDPERRKVYSGPVEEDRYGRAAPKPAHGSIPLPRATSSSRAVIAAMLTLYDRITDPMLTVRRIYVVAEHVTDENTVSVSAMPEQMDMFTDYDALNAESEKARTDETREKQAQLAVLALKKKYGKNAVLRGMNLQDGATARERNSRIGGHKA